MRITTESLTTKHNSGVCHEFPIKLILLPSSHLCCHPRQVSTGSRQHGISIHHVATEVGRKALHAAVSTGCCYYLQGQTNRIQQFGGWLAAITLQYSTETVMLVPSQDGQTQTTQPGWTDTVMLA